MSKEADITDVGCDVMAEGLTIQVRATKAVRYLTASQCASGAAPVSAAALAGQQPQ
jgi:hypothetical protein